MTAGRHGNLGGCEHATWLWGMGQIGPVLVPVLLTLNTVTKLNMCQGLRPAPHLDTVASAPALDTLNGTPAVRALSNLHTVSPMHNCLYSSVLREHQEHVTRSVRDNSLGDSSTARHVALHHCPAVSAWIFGCHRTRPPVWIPPVVLFVPSAPQPVRPPPSLITAWRHPSSFTHRRCARLTLAVARLFSSI